MFIHKASHNMTDVGSVSEKNVKLAPRDKMEMTCLVSQGSYWTCKRRTSLHILPLVYMVLL